MTSIFNSLQSSFLPILLAVVTIGVLALTIRGIPGNPTSKDLNDPRWKDEGPLELSPDRGRFALTYSLIEDKSFQFSIDVARFAAPDVAVNNGKFASLFAPTLSYVIAPGYMIGKMLGASQVGAFAVIAVFAILNTFLIRSIAIKLGAHPIAGTIAGLLFLFASPGFAYAVTLYQHHVSTFLILCSIYILLQTKRIIPLTIVWFFCAVSISLDNPNLFLMFPIGLYALTRIISLKAEERSYTIRILPFGFLTLTIMAIPIAFFLYFNKMSYGNPFQLGGTVAAAAVVDEFGKVDLPEIQKRKQEEKLAKQQETTNKGQTEQHKKEAVGFFKTRDLPNGLYTHFFSLDRGMWLYTPVLLLGFVGFFFFSREKSMRSVMLAIIGVNVLLYSLWGDPYGGWAFGSRYLIPSYALLAIGISLLLTQKARNLFIVLVIFILSIYSVGVNTIGALTSNRNPPYVQILDLESLTKRPEKYTYERNMEMLNSNHSKSFVFQIVARQYMSAWQYMWIISGILSCILFFLFLGMVVNAYAKHR